MVGSGKIEGFKRMLLRKVCLAGIFWYYLSTEEDNFSKRNGSLWKRGIKLGACHNNTDKPSPPHVSPFIFPNHAYY